MDIDGRDGVFRFNPANFFDNDLCVRAFGMSASEVVSRLAGHCELTKEVDGGAFLLTTDRPIVGVESVEMDIRIRKALGVPWHPVD
ncbi:hypothetical protein [Achromobacter sp.]|uniref:hypothetical protein n=1 Tax=Achromobacter sp. TaxID=134375 RepID=UPI0028AB9147|nr:hypothetical protein [Achromobacter sp.]